MLTKEEKSRIARENGAKSRGPKTQAGKNRSRANGLKHGERATTLKQLAQPHPAILCNEDSHHFFQVFHDLIKVYRPIGPVALDIVREIAIARVDITRTQHIKAAMWNRAILLEQAKDHNVQPDLIPVEIAINTGLQMLKAGAQFDRAIDRLFNRIAKLEKRLCYVDTTFPVCEPSAPIETAYDQTDIDNTEVVENEQLPPEQQPPLYTDDPSQATREAYEYFFPGRKLIVVKKEKDLDPN
jgi:hypothetical protein